MRFLLAGILFSSLLFSLGCGKNNPSSSNSQNSTEPPIPAGLMMKEDPRSIKHVEGNLLEVDSDHLVIHTRKNVSLKFKRDSKTKVVPQGAVLSPGTDVRIDIEHIPVGMRADRIEVLQAPIRER